jgi:uncharacterized membrane protein YdjX (TVP38/TMEM64 family)
VEDRSVKRLGTIWRLIVLVGLISAIAYLALHQEFLQRSLLERGLLRFSRLAPILFVLVYAAATVLFVPGSILTIAGGALFGPVWGTLWNLSGATLGATLAFLIARYVASDWVSRTTGEHLTRLMRGVEEEGWRFVALVRLVPFFPFNLVNYAFGLTRIRITEYVAASFVCMAPGALAYTWLGYAGQEAASGQSTAIREGLLALALLAAVAFLPRLIRRLKRPRFIDPDELKRRLDSGEQLALIDVRTPDEFLGPLGHIVSAENIPVVQLHGEIGKIKESREKLLVTI